MVKISENEKKFLNKLYDDMLVNELIDSSNTPNDRDDKIKIVNEYLDRLKRVEDKAVNSSREHDLERLKKFYYKRYVIKEKDIPESYYELQQKIAFERGMGRIELTEEQREEMARTVINDQKKSLDIWLDYFMSQDGAFYPYKLKYWAFQGMLKMGSYDKEKQTFNRRGKHTTNIFVDLDKEALGLTINEMAKYLKNEEIEDDTLNELLNNGSFVKIYTYYFNKLQNIKKDYIKSDEGIWIKYDQGTDYMPLVKSLEGMGTGWCTAGETTAKMQLENGDFYVYYTKDRNGEFKIPRIAIRMNRNSIGEIRGVASNQNIESNMEKVVEEKLQEFPDRDRYKKKVADMKRMTEIYEKHTNGEELTKEDLMFLYEINSKIKGFGYQEDPRIEEIKEKRNVKKDIKFVLNLDCNEDEIATNMHELEENCNKVVYYYGNLETRKEEVYYPKLRYINGTARFEKLKTTRGLESLTTIEGDAHFDSLKTIEGLENLTTIGGDAHFDSLKTIEGLDNLTTIEGDAQFYYLETIEGLRRLTTIGGDAYFNSLETAEGLEELTTIGGDANFYILETAEGLEKLTTIGGDANFAGLKTAEGLEKLTTIGGNANFSSLKTAEGLEKLTTIGGEANFFSLETAEGLEELATIGISANFDSLGTAEGLGKLTTIGLDANFSGLETAEGLDELATIGRYAYFDNLQTAKGLDKIKIGFKLYIPNELELQIKGKGK